MSFTRFLPDLKVDDKQSFTAIVKGFDAEVLYIEKKYRGYNSIYYSENYNRLPKFSLRIRLSNIESNGKELDVTDPTIPFGKYFKQHGFPNIGDRIAFNARPAVGRKIKAFKYVASVKFLDHNLRPVINQSEDNFDVLGYLLVKRQHDLRLVRNCQGCISRLPINSKVKRSINRCINKYHCQNDDREHQLLGKFKWQIFHKENVQEYCNVENLHDTIYTKDHQLVDSTTVRNILSENLKDQFGKYSKQQFCKEFGNDDGETFDTSVLTAFETIHLLIDDPIID